MSDTVIRVENLSKKYIIGHQQQGRSRYTALRDVLTEGAQSIGRRILNPFAQQPPSPTKEEFWALKDVSFEIKQGDRVGIIGRNGAGKSTLLKLLSRITEPTTGRISIKGRVASLLEVGTGFHPELTGRENIYLNGAILGMSKAEIRRTFDEIVAFAEVEKFLDTPVKYYSSGMYVRLAFAVAAYLEPEILIIDEVLAVGDAQFQKKCLGKMEDVGNEGRTVLFVSHNMTALKSLCTKGIYLLQGQVKSYDKALNAVASYLSEKQADSLLKTWKEPEILGNINALIHSVKICDEKGNLLNEVFTNTTFNIEIEFETIKDGASVGFTVMFFDSEFNSILTSISNHEEIYYGKPMPQGRFKSICKIPANFFNNGWFTLGINIFSKGFSDVVADHDILRFEILDSPDIRGDFYGNISGMIRPLLEWKTVESCLGEL